MKRSRADGSPISARSLRKSSARRRIGAVCSLPVDPLPRHSTHTPAVTCTALNDLHPAFPFRHCPPTSRPSSELAFKSHSAPRPPQTPTASSLSKTPRIGIPLRRKSLPEAFPIKASDDSGIVWLGFPRSRGERAAHLCSRNRERGRHYRKRQ